eukprot:CAMPEP_0201569610 /NCGR_PEP_ID=MMETSP0190_2-20130828/11390_1 /ASSEMBLY_ACC=CAM_ASM_000263 /TAXON_ID=37353 /ORGANISM="Rosalina sp." /LENGTH=544 /DNA_ID=CAMNT_0047992119 /DNA_START=1039 /DNA_END=2673 /DNA_ORIENTATION=-
MNDTGSTTTKSVTSSTKSVSIAYEINDSVANHSPLNRNKKQSSNNNNNNGDFKLPMVDHSSSGSTQSTNSKDDNDDNQMNDFHQDTGYVDGYDEQYLDDEFMKELPPTVEMGGFHQNPSQQQSMRSFGYSRSSRPFGNNAYMNNMIMNNINMNNINMNINNRRRASSLQHQRINNGNHHHRNSFINSNVMQHGIVTGNHLINDVIDEVVYEPDFKIEQMTNNNNNNGYYDGAYTMYQSSEYPQDPVNNNNPNLNLNNINNHNNTYNNIQNYQNSNINSNMLCVEDGVSSIPLMQQNSNIAPIQIQQPFIPQYPNTANLVTLPTLNRPFPIHTNTNNNQRQYDQINDNQPQSINMIQRSVPMLRPQQSTNSTHSSRSYHTNNGNNNNNNITPETALTGQSSSSSADLSLSSHGSYAPSRGTNINLKAATKRHSPISTPTTPTTPNTPRMRNRMSNTSTSSSSSTPMNYNDYTMVNNRRMIDSYQITPFSPSFDQVNNNNNGAPQQSQMMDVPQQVMMNDGNNDNNFVFTNLSNISSPTPLLGGFL